MKQSTCFMLILFGLILAACAGQSTPPYETVAPAAIEPNSDIPAPTENVVVIISGSIETHNSPDGLHFDIPTLEKLGLVKYTVEDPWLHTSVTYTGVLLSELLKYSGISDSAQTVRVIALDDYTADIPISEIEAWPIMLAIQADEEYLTIHSNGPTRIIFPYDTYSDLAAARNMSVWNIKGLEVK